MNGFITPISEGAPPKRLISLQDCLSNRKRVISLEVTSIWMMVSTLYWESTVNFRLTCCWDGRLVTQIFLSGCSRSSSMARRMAQALGRSIVPLFITVTKALVTSPMPCVMSMLVLQPRMARFTDCIGDGVNVSVGGIGVKVVVGVGVNVISAVTGEITVTFDDGVSVFTKTGGGMRKGVGVLIPGVNEGMGVHTGKA